MAVDTEAIYKSTMVHYYKAKSNISESRMNNYQASALSDVVPGFEADKLEFGSYDKGNFAVLFVDMRFSTERAQRYSPEITFLTMHVYLTALIEVVKLFRGKVIDIMGDGLMVFWGGKEARENDGMYAVEAVRNAGKCGLAMLQIREEVINKIINSENLGNEINIGVGITFDSVIVTKIGIQDYSYDVKAFGDCINKAFKYANQNNINKLKVSKKVKEIWPSSKTGILRFINDNDGYFVESR